MAKRNAPKASGPSHGLDAIILEVLGKVASPDACASLIGRALKRARLGKMPEDPVVLLAFASGALRGIAEEAFGEEMAEELLADLRPILERAAEHAVAMEQAAERAVGDAHGAAAGGSDATAAVTSVQTDMRRTWPHGRAAPAAAEPATAAPEASPMSGPTSGRKDPKRNTLTYQSAEDEFLDGLSGGKITVVVVDRDEALRTTIARMLRREGWAVVTAPDAELGLTLCMRVTAQVVVFDAAVAGLDARLRERLGDRAPHTVALVSGSKPPEVAPVADRVLNKSLAPEQLLAALEGLLPEARRR
jgi:CheY-like chemotaxis protein